MLRHQYSEGRVCRGKQFCKKVTYNAEDQRRIAFQNEYYRIAVTVDMIATD